MSDQGSVTGADNGTAAGAPHGEDLFEEVGAKLTELGDAVGHVVADIDRKAGRDIFAATATGVILLVAIGASLLWWPWGMVAIVLFMVVGGEIEVTRVLRRQTAAQPVIWPLVIGSAALVVGAYGWHFWPGLRPAWWVIGVVGVTVVAVLLIRLGGPIEGYVRDVSATVLLLLYIAVLAATLVYILAGPQGPGRLATLILAVVATDTGGYAVGVFLGKHPMWPRISPKKSWEGLAGSIGLSMVVSACMAAFLLRHPWWQGVIVGFVVTVFAVGGDLVESIIKRDLGVKDMGHIIAGHGGILDRVDSYLIAAVPGWLTMALLWSHV